MMANGIHPISPECKLSFIEGKPSISSKPLRDARDEQRDVIFILHTHGASWDLLRHSFLPNISTENSDLQTENLGTYAPTQGIMALFAMIATNIDALAKQENAEATHG